MAEQRGETDEQRAARYAALEAAAPTLTASEYRQRTRRSMLSGIAAAGRQRQRK